MQRCLRAILLLDQCIVRSIKASDTYRNEDQQRTHCLDDLPDVHWDLRLHFYCIVGKSGRHEFIQFGVLGEMILERQNDIPIEKQPLTRT